MRSWSQIQNINDQDTVEEIRKKYYPMIEFCVRVARCQMENGGFFIIENPARSKIWLTKAIQSLLKGENVSWDTLDICAFGMVDPTSLYKIWVNHLGQYSKGAVTNLGVASVANTNLWKAMRQGTDPEQN